MVEIITMDCTLSDSIDSTGYRDPISLLGYDIIIWDVNEVYEEYGELLRNDQIRYLSDSEKYKLNNDHSRRNSEFKQLFEQGKFVIIFIPEIKEWNYDIYISPLDSYTSPSPFTLESLIPISGIKLNQGSGYQIEFKGNNEYLKYFYDLNRDIFYYYSYLTDLPVGSFLCINGTQHIVGAFFNILKGFCLLLPSISNTSEDEKEKKIRYLSFVDSVKKLFGELKQGDGLPPEWVNTVLLPDEISIKEKITTHLQQIEKLKGELNKLIESLSPINHRKVLLYGSGDYLHKSVEECFSELGFSIIESTTNRTDLLMKYDARYVVCEIKGVERSAAEKSAAQLEKWVSECFEEYKEDPKAILVINGYRKDPIGERRRDVFTNQMIPYSTKRGHCLITTCQLLNLYYDVINNPDKKTELIEELLQTEGPYKKYLKNPYFSVQSIE